MKTLLISLFIIYVAFASQYVTIPKRQIGILIGKPDAQVKIQLIYDPVCDGTADFDKQFQQVFDSLNSDLKSRISLRFISLSLPYHIASQKLTQGIIYVLNTKGSQQAVTLFRNFLQNKETWYQENIRNQTIGGFMIKIADKINSLFGIKTQDTLKQLVHGSKSDATLRSWSKLVMGSMKIAGTPRLRINGVTVDGVTDMTNQQLSDLIKSLFANTRQKLHH